jgi:hypothetical protein
MNGGGLSYQKRPGDGGTLSVILNAKVGVNVVLSSPRAGERGKNDAVREGHSTDLEGCEENRRLGGRRHLFGAGGSSLSGGVKLETVAGWMGSDISSSTFYTPKIPKRYV